MKILAIANLICWILFIDIDLRWNSVISEAVAMGQKTYGERYGPLSFFRPILLYFSLILTVVLSGLVVFHRKDNLAK